MNFAKKLLILPLALALLNAPIAQAEGGFGGSESIGILASLAVAGIIPQVFKKIAEYGPIKSVGRSVGIHPQDVGRVVGLTAGFLGWGLSLGTKKEQPGHTYWILGKRTPITALTMGFYMTQTGQTIINNIPVIKDSAGCDNPDCPNVCHHCKLTKFTIGSGLANLVHTGLESYFPGYYK